MLTSAAGAVTDVYEYDAFGNEINHTGTTPNDYLYRGEQYDSDLGLYYLRARWYNPVTGRFMTRDPYEGSIYDPVSLHRYNYTRANPVNRVDPSGRADIAEDMLVDGGTYTAKAAGLTVAGYAIRCVLYADASALDLVGLHVDQVITKMTLLFQGCAAQITVQQFARDTTLNLLFMGLGEASGQGIGWLMDGAEQGEMGLLNCCFAAGTAVHTDHGDVPIERIRVGDKVLSRNRTTGKQEYKRVTGLTAQHRDRLIELQIEGEQDPLRPAIDHPFWVLRAPSQKAAWIEANAMRGGDLVLDLKGEWHRVVSVRLLEGLQTVYNFEVEDNHDYFVGTTGLLVHNSGNCRLFHGTEIQSAFNISEYGIQSEASSFFMSSSEDEAQFYAETKSDGGVPAMVSITIPDSLVAELEAAGDLQVDGTIYRFLPGAWQILNELGFYLEPLEPAQ